MSITAIAVFAIFFLGLILAFAVHPIFAIFSYLWIFYNHPPAFWWGVDVPELRYSLIAAMVALVSSFRLKDKPLTPWSENWGARLLILYAAWMWCQSPWAINPDAHLEGAILWTKYLILHYIIFRVVANTHRIEMFLWAHVVGCFLLGWVAYTTISNGRLESVGGPGVDDSNLLAAHLITSVAAAGFMFLGLKGYRRWVALGCLPFILNAIILTQSRGGLLALVASGFVAWYLAPKVHQRSVTLSIATGAFLFLFLSNADFWARISTIYGSDANPAEEVRAGLIGPQFRMFIDHPLGAGHRGNEFLSIQYMPTELLAGNSGRRSAHNTFMAVLVDQGVPGATILIALYFWVGVTLIKQKILDAHGLPPIMGTYRAILGTALFSCFVSGLFLNLLKSEVQIWLLALLASLSVLANHEIERKQDETAQQVPNT